MGNQIISNRYIVVAVNGGNEGGWKGSVWAECVWSVARMLRFIPKHLRIYC